MGKADTSKLLVGHLEGWAGRGIWVAARGRCRDGRGGGFGRRPEVGGGWDGRRRKTKSYVSAFWFASAAIRFLFPFIQSAMPLAPGKRPQLLMVRRFVRDALALPVGCATGSCEHLVMATSRRLLGIFSARSDFFRLPRPHPSHQRNLMTESSC